VLACCCATTWTSRWSTLVRGSSTGSGRTSSWPAPATGDLDGLLSLLAPDATWTADSGGKTTDFSAIRNPDKLLAMTVPRQISR
jgi:hypothetical protein